MSGPGVYVPDVTEGITRVEDLPQPRIKPSRSFSCRRCPFCGGRAGRWGVAFRTVHDLGEPLSGRPIDLHIRYSTHRCSVCRRSFPADLSDLAPRKSHYTHRVQQTAVRLVVEDDLPYRMASWHLARSSRLRGYPIIRYYCKILTYQEIRKTRAKRMIFRCVRRTPAT